MALTVVKPVSGSMRDGWEWDGKELKPVSGSRRDAWEVGNTPIPVIAGALVVLKLFN